MTREEIDRRLEEGEDPLTLSITKWENVWLGLSRTISSHTCPLCIAFLKYGQSCKYCPIYRYTRRKGCGGTPYHKFLDHYYNCVSCYTLSICGKGRRLARKEVNFLKKLAKW